MNANNPPALPEPDGEVYVAQAGGLVPIGPGYTAANVRGLYAHVQVRAAQIAALRAEVEALRAKNATLLEALRKAKTAALPTEVRDVVNAAIDAARAEAPKPVGGA